MGATPTVEQQVWAAATLADLPTSVTFHADAQVRVGQSTDGQPVRKAFVIVVTPNGKKRFNINLLSGAWVHELEHARALIAAAKEGDFDPDLWTPREGGGWVCRAWWSYDLEKPRRVLLACTDSGCVEQFHAWQDDEFDDYHRLDPIEAEHYTVRGENWGDGWKANFIDDLDCEGPAGLKVLRDLANDYAWMQAECDKLNAAAEVSAR